MPGLGLGDFVGVEHSDDFSRVVFLSDSHLFFLISVAYPTVYQLLKYYGSKLRFILYQNPLWAHHQAADVAVVRYFEIGWANVVLLRFLC